MPGVNQILNHHSSWLTFIYNISLIILNLQKFTTTSPPPHPPQHTHTHTHIHTQTYMDYIRGLPINDTPEMFGLHDNANITFALNETFQLLEGILLLQPKSSKGAGKSREEVSWLAKTVIKTYFTALAWFMTQLKLCLILCVVIAWFMARLMACVLY